MQGFMVKADGYKASQHFSWLSFIKEAELLANVSLYQPRDYHKHHHHKRK
jgi:hypothetical protein